MNEEELKSYIEAGREGRRLEYKGSESWDNPEFKASLIKTVLAMSNLKDGGTIVIGVKKQTDGTYFPEGVSQEHFESFKNEDTIQMGVAEYADPSAEFSREMGSYNGRNFVVILVREFEELPIICKRDGARGLRKGDIYTRTRRHPETAVVPSQTEMREIIELAVDKGMQRLKKRGYIMKGQTTAGQQFLKQLEDFE